MRLLVVYTFYK